LLAPQFLLIARGKKRVLLVVVFSLCLLPLVFPFFRYLFWGFTGDYFRTLCLFQTIVLLVVALYALSSIERHSRVYRTLLAFTVLILLVLLHVPLLAGHDLFAPPIRMGATVFVLVYSFCLVGLSSSRSTTFAAGMMLLAVCVELGWFSSTTANDRKTIDSSELDQPIGYNDQTVEAVEYLRSIDTSFYRVEKHYSSGLSDNPSLNDAQIQRYYGTASYHSFNQPSYIRFLQAADIIPEQSEPHARWAFGLRYSPQLHSFASIKYFLTRKVVDPYLQEGYDVLASLGEITVLRNPHALPLGFSYERYCTEKEFMALTRTQKQWTLMKGFVVGEEEANLTRLFERMTTGREDGAYMSSEHEADLQALRRDTLAISRWGQNRVEGTITGESRKMLFFSIPHDRGWSATVNGNEAALYRVNIGFMGVIIEPGQHTVVLQYRPPYLRSGVIGSIASLLVYGGLLFVSLRRKR